MLASGEWKRRNTLVNTQTTKISWTDLVSLYQRSPHSTFYISLKKYSLKYSFILDRYNKVFIIIIIIIIIIIKWNLETMLKTPTRFLKDIS